MKRFFSAGFLFLFSLVIVTCGPAPAPPEADGALESTDTPLPIPAVDTEAAAATEEIPQNIIRLGPLELVPFAPPWFDGDLSTAVFAQNILLRIDAPPAPYEPGKNNVMGAVVLNSFESFNISATFDAEGGACRGIDFCGNTDVFNCIVFDFADYDNMQKFCIAPSALFWHLVAFENGAVVYDSSVQPGDAIHDTFDIYRGKHPLPNELRLMLQAGILSGYINGVLVFERDGTRIEGKIGVGCINTSLDPRLELSNCEVAVAIGP